MLCYVGSLFKSIFAFLNNTVRCALMYKYYETHVSWITHGDNCFLCVFCMRLISGEQEVVMPVALAVSR